LFLFTDRQMHPANSEYSQIHNETACSENGTQVGKPAHGAAARVLPQKNMRQRNEVARQ
jgi:hypothetical protein